MNKLQIKFKEAPEGIGQIQQFESQKHLTETVNEWEKTGKITKSKVSKDSIEFHLPGDKNKTVVDITAPDRVEENEGE